MIPGEHEEAFLDSGVLDNEEPDWRALADDLATTLTRVWLNGSHWHDEYERVMARYREARQR